MAIYRSMQEGVFDPELVAIMSAAYEDALGALNLRDRSDPITEIVAHEIIQFTLQGGRDPVKLRDLAVQSLSH
jgi:hypothetical protein